MLPPPPAEPPRIATFDSCAPAFARAVEAIVRDMQQQGHRIRVFETLRTRERQDWLYGMGRFYSDGRAGGGTVTNVRGMFGWHPYGLAADLVEDDATPWAASTAFWQALGRCAEAHGLTWGGRWKQLDLPHVQWGRCRRTPSPRARTLLREGGLRAVWAEVGAL